MNPVVNNILNYFPWVRLHEMSHVLSEDSSQTLLGVRLNTYHWDNEWQTQCWGQSQAGVARAGFDRNPEVHNYRHNNAKQQHCPRIRFHLHPPVLLCLECLSFLFLVITCIFLMISNIEFFVYSLIICISSLEKILSPCLTHVIFSFLCWVFCIFSTLTSKCPCVLETCHQAYLLTVTPALCSVNCFLFSLT